MDCKQKCFFWGMGEMRMRQEEVVFGWEAGKVSLQSRAKGVGRAGNPSRKNSYGDSLPLVECAAAASFV